MFHFVTNIYGSFLFIWNDIKEPFDCFDDDLLFNI